MNHKIISLKQTELNNQHPDQQFNIPFLGHKLKLKFMSQKKHKKEQVDEFIRFIGQGKIRLQRKRVSLQDAFLQTPFLDDIENSNLSEQNKIIEKLNLSFNLYANETIVKMLSQFNKVHQTIIHILAKKEFLKVLIFIKKKIPSILRLRDGYGRTALHYAIETKNKMLALWLIEHEPDLADVVDLMELKPTHDPKFLKMGFSSQERYKFLNKYTIV